MSPELQQYIQRRKEELLNPDGSYKVKAPVVPGRFSASISVVDKSKHRINSEVKT